PCLAEPSSPTLTGIPSISPSSLALPTPPVFSPATPFYRQWKSWLVIILLIGPLIFLTGSVRLGYIIPGGVGILSPSPQIPGSGRNNTSASSPGRTTQASTATRQTDNATTTSTVNNATAIPNGNTSPTPTPASPLACISVTPSSLTFAS